MMKKAGKTVAIILTFIIVFAYLVTCLTPYVSPRVLPVLTLFSIAYIPIILLFLLVIIGWLFFRPRIALILLLLLLPGYKNIFANLGFNFFVKPFNIVKPANSIRVMSWNVNELGSSFTIDDTLNSHRDKVIRFINYYQPDILCVQDMDELEGPEFISNINKIAQFSQFSHQYFPFFYRYNGSNYRQMYGVVIFSRLPFADTGSVLMSEINPERVAFADVVFNGQKLRVINAHLTSMSLWPNTTDSAGLKYFTGNNTKKRLRGTASKVYHYGKEHAAESETLKRFINSSPYPVILAADINSVPSSYVYHHLHKGLNDAFLQKDFGVGGTYNRVFPKLRIDLILHSRHLEVQQFKRPVAVYSDHYPVVADMTWKE